MDMKITREMLSNSPAAPLLPMQQLFNPMDIRNTTRLRNVAADHERFCNLPIPSGTTDHTQTSVTIISRAQHSGEVEFLSATQRNSKIDESFKQFNLGFIFKRGLGFTNRFLSIYGGWGINPTPKNTT